MTEPRAPGIPTPRTGDRNLDLLLNAMRERLEGLTTSVNARAAAQPAEPEAAPDEGGAGAVTTFESAGQTIAMASLFTLAHGLGQVPFAASAWLRCLTAEYGYAVGDELAAPTAANDNTGASTNFVSGVGVSMDGTNVYLTTPGSGDVNGIRIHRKNAPIGAIVSITAANWELFARAWAA